MFDFVPRILVLASTYLYTCVNGCPEVLFIASTDVWVLYTLWLGKTVKWYSVRGAGYQNNDEGQTNWYAAIG